MTVRENEREQEFAWGRGKWISREKRPNGYAASLDNCEILADAAIRDLRGAAIQATVAGKNLRHGVRFLKRGGVTATIVIASDGTIWRIETGTPVAIGTTSASLSYSSAQAIDRLYIATGADTGVIFDSGGGVLTTGATGLPTPAAPTIGSTTPSGTLAAPTTAPTTNAKLTFVGTTDAFLQHSRTARTMERYNVTTNTWTPMPPIPDLVAAPSTIYDTFYSPGLNAIVALWEIQTPPTPGATRYALFRLALNLWNETGIAKDASGGLDFFLCRGSEFSAPPAGWIGVSAEPHGIAGHGTGVFLVVFRLRGLSGLDLIFDRLAPAIPGGPNQLLFHRTIGLYAPSPWIRTQINYSDTQGRIYYQLTGDLTESSGLPFLWFRQDNLHTIPNGTITFGDPTRLADDGVPNDDFNSYTNRGIGDRFIHVLERIDPGPIPRFRHYDTIGLAWDNDIAPFTGIGRPTVSLSPTERVIYHYSLVGTDYGLPFVRTAI